MNDSIPGGRIAAAICICAMLAAPFELRGEDLQLSVQLLGPIDTRLNQEGDQITAQVTSPETYKGAILEGQIRHLKSSGKTNKASEVRLAFENMIFNGEVWRVRADVASFTNSKGQQDADEEGNVVQRSRAGSKAALFLTMAGAAAGGMAGGARGAAIGAGAGLAAGLIVARFVIKAPAIRFATGSVLVLDASLNK